MKKYILSAIVILACAVYAANTPWDGKGNPEWNSWNPSKTPNIGTEYTATKGNVTFTYTWGAAHQNQMWSYERTDIDTGYKYEGGTFEFTSDYVWTDFEARTDIRNHQQVGDIVEFGYYTIDTDGQVSALKPMMTLDENGNRIETSVIFEKGEKIGVYATLLQNGSNVTFTSTPVEGMALTAPNVDTNSRGDANQYFCLFDDRTGKGIGNYSHYEFYLPGLIASTEGQSYDDFLDDVIEYIETHPDDIDPNIAITDSNGNAVGGQPLPGLLLSLVIGGTAVAGFSKKRKKA